MNKIYIAILFVFIGVNLVAQEQIIPEKCFYKNDEGKLYVNKELPIYIWLSTSKDEGAKKYRLFSVSTKQYSNPFYFDTEGINTVRTPSAVDTVTKRTIYPEQDIIFEVYADDIKPTSKISFDDQKPFKKEGKYWFNSNGKVSFSAKDGLSGISKIYYSIDKKAYVEYSDAIILKESKEYFIQYYSTDNVGNVEDIKDIQIVIDNTSPKTILEFGSDKHENVFSSRTTFSLKSEDEIAGVKEIKYEIDDFGEKKYVGTLRASYLQQGAHTIKYYAIDNVGNKEEPSTYEFYVDKTAPIVMEEIEATNFVHNGVEYSSGRSRFKITAIDNKAGIKEVYYSINGAKYELYEKPFFLKNVGGILRIKTYAVDNVNNRSSSEQSTNKAKIPYIDLTGPTISHLFQGKKFSLNDTTYITSETLIKLRGSDGEAGMKEVQYNLDKKGAITYTEPILISEQGLHNLSYTGYDNVGNTNNKETFCFVDNIGPEVFERYSTNELGTKDFNGESVKVFPSHMVLFISSTDHNVGLDKITYSINGQAEKLLASYIQGFTANTDYIITVYSYDKLGNKTVKEIKFAIN